MIVGLFGDDPLFDFLTNLDSANFNFLHVESAKDINLSAAIVENPELISLNCPILTKSEKAGRLILGTSVLPLEDSSFFLIPSSPFLVLNELANQLNIPRDLFCAGVVWFRGGSSLGKNYIEAIISESVSVLNFQQSSTVLDEQVAFNINAIPRKEANFYKIFPKCSLQQFSMPVLNGEVLIISIPSSGVADNLNNLVDSTKKSLLETLDEPEAQLASVSSSENLTTVTFFIDNISLEAAYVLKTLSVITNLPA